jgi:hypothetical protein
VDGPGRRGHAGPALIGPLPNAPVLWPLPLPIVFLGLGLMLYYALASDRAR